jgi:hypothetical protein
MSRTPGTVTVLLLSLCMTSTVAAGEIPQEALEKVDALIVTAYQAAGAKLPCKIGTGGKLHMLHWQDVDKCMSKAIFRVDWEEFSMQLEALRPPDVTENAFAAMVEIGLLRHALPYNRVFRVGDKKALLPLTNPILKYLPADALQDQPVFDATGAEIGKFVGIYTFEKAGGTVSGNTVKTTLFQYRDREGKLQVPAARLLLDSFGVPWEKIMEKPGFRLPADQLKGIGAVR